MVIALMLTLVGDTGGQHVLEKVSTGHTFTEGPVWSPWGTLLFSDIPESKIWELGKEPKIYREPSGNSNGLTFDRQGRLIACEHGNRRVSRTEKDGSITVLADKYEGKRLNSPNDVAVRFDGSVYFTDPPYGISPDQQELGFQGVYRIKPDGKLELLLKDLTKPNGICFSPDEKRLYIAVSDKPGFVKVFDVAPDGSISNGRQFADHWGDGIKVDVEGKLYVTTTGGVRIYSPDGKLVDTIEVKEQTANCAWGDADGKSLFITASGNVYKVRMPVGGRPPYTRESTASKAVLSCDTYSLRDYFGQGKIDYLTVPKLLADIGIHGVTYNDIWMKSYDTAYLDQLRKACADAGVKITGLICEGNMATPDDAAWNKQIETNSMKMRAAAYLGAPIVRFDLGSLGSEEKDDTVGAQRCIEAFKKLIPLAKELNIKMTIENHGGVSKKADTIVKVIEGAGKEWVGSCLDFGNWPDDEIYSESAKLAAYAYHVHAKTHSFNDKGEDVNKDYKRLMQMMKDTNYKYAVSIEYEGGEDQVEGVKKTRDLILRYWPELGG